MNDVLAPGVLVVDDEPELRSLLVDYFEHQGLRAEGAESAAAARQIIAMRRPAVALLDVRMPGEDGLSLARWLRRFDSAIGIVFLTTATEVIDRVVGLEVGADDYIPKPFELRELLARVKSLVRRLDHSRARQVTPPLPVEAERPVPRRVAVGRCMLELDERRLVDANGTDLGITASEFDLLALLVNAPRRPFSRDQIMDQAHGRSRDVFDRSIDLRIMRLRRKVEFNPVKPELLKTVRNVGYVFVPAPAPADEPR